MEGPRFSGKGTQAATEVGHTPGKFCAEGGAGGSRPWTLCGPTARVDVGVSLLLGGGLLVPMESACMDVWAQVWATGLRPVQ